MMKYIVLLLLATIDIAHSDACNVPCTRIAGLCDSNKGSWCNESQNCQNLFITGYDFCYMKKSGDCAGRQPVKCSNVKKSMAEYKINTDPDFGKTKISSDEEFYAGIDRMRREGNFIEAGPFLNLKIANPGF